ncbi:MAG: hypothetical protein U0Q16_37845 [Bryobacteraceae bacterium]
MKLKEIKVIRGREHVDQTAFDSSRLFRAITPHQDQRHRVPAEQPPKPAAGA